MQQEIEYRLAQGQKQVSFAAFKAAYAELGYTFDRSSDCKSMARHMTGPQAGMSYLCLSLYPVQIDNGVSAWNVDARRDDRYTTFQALRNQIFAVVRNYIIEV